MGILEHQKINWNNWNWNGRCLFGSQKRIRDNAENLKSQSLSCFLSTPSTRFSFIIYYIYY